MIYLKPMLDTAVVGIFDALPKSQPTVVDQPLTPLKAPSAKKCNMRGNIFSLFF